ncbi:hypothetical protein ABUK73_17855 [Agrobacterium sp. BA1120]|uniref:hypothetical protein n=1 Tax=Agrobacterium sp. BA1120 TaxID=3228927 RepID=UPI00336A12DD
MLPRLATWNIQTLATPGRKVFDTSTARLPADYEDLRTVERELSADVYALQEISSPAALSQVFPLSEFVLCFSGQGNADARKLGPQYDFEGPAAGIKPECFEEAGATLPDTATTPRLPDGAADPLLAQHTALAVRRVSGTPSMRSRICQGSVSRRTTGTGSSVKSSCATSAGVWAGSRGRCTKCNSVTGTLTSLLPSPFFRATIS